MGNRLPHKTGATTLISAASGIALPSSPPTSGQVLTYSGTTGALHWDNQQAGTLEVFTPSENGLAPASGGGTSNFLRADGTWNAPPGGGGGGGVGGSVYERQSTFGVPVLTSGLQEATLGNIGIGGSVLGFTGRLLEARTAGDVLVKIKVQGTTVQSGQFNATYPLSISASSPIGTYPVVAGDELTIEVSNSSTFTTASGITVGLVVNVLMADSTTSGTAANLALLDTAQTWTKGQVVEQVTLGSGTVIPVDASLSNNFELLLNQSPQTLGNPSNVTPGATLNFAVRQDGTGSRTLNFDSVYKFSAGAPDLPTAANEEYLVSCYVRATASGLGSVLLCSRTDSLL